MTDRARTPHVPPYGPADQPPSHQPGPHSHTVRGKRRATPTKHRMQRVLDTLPRLAGVGALAVAVSGAMLSANDEAAVSATARDLQVRAAPPSAYGGSSVTTSNRQSQSRQQAISRDAERPALGEPGETSMEDLEAKARQRDDALKRLAAGAKRYAETIEANAWVLPLEYYRLTATFGEASSLWSSTHTGLDFAAPSGTPVRSVAAGTVTSAGYAGAYGNQVIVTLPDGTELWYNHLTSFDVAPEAEVQAGQQVGTVGATGNVTGPHLHLEVRPGAGDAVDPYAALVARGLQP